MNGAEKAESERAEREENQAENRLQERAEKRPQDRAESRAENRLQERAGNRPQDRAESQAENGPQNRTEGSAGKADGQESAIREAGQVLLEGESGSRIRLISVIGEIEGHENLSGSTKTTKYEHLLPRLAEIEESRETDGVLILINTVGGDVSCGLALAEMIASLSKPTVSLVIGDSHSIGVPLAVAADYSFIVPTGTMMVHPVRMSGLIIGASQTYDYFEMIQDRILSFVSSHSRISYERLRALMLNTEMMTRDLGTVLVGREAVREGLIDETGGIREAFVRLNAMIRESAG